MQSSRPRIAAALILTVLTTFLLSVVWESGLEKLVCDALGLAYDSDYERAEYIRFVLTSTGFAIVSLVVPAIMLLRMFGRLQDAHNSTIAAQELAQSLARHDPLTGLPNRRLFFENLQQAMRDSRARKGDCAVFLIDLDHFKFVNDLFGHEAGDRVLCHAAERIAAIVPAGGTVARLGGDEFAMIVAGEHLRERALRQAQRVAKALSEPVPFQTGSIEMSATVGIAIMSTDHDDPASLLRAADIAMYRAKESARGSFQFFEESMDRELKVRARLEADLRKAVAGGDITPSYQPLISLPDRRLIGFEILARWHRPEGTVSPDVFIPVAEELGLASALSCALLRRACRDAAEWDRTLQGGKGEIAVPLRLALNVSPMQLVDDGLAQHILAILTETGFPAGRLEIEISETTLIGNLEKVGATLISLHNLGLSISLDDFGTGYSSLMHLHHLRVDKVKIDRSFVMWMSKDSESRKVVEAALRIGNSLGLVATAEGIESEDDARWLAEHGCVVGQGYLFGKPMLASDVPAFVKRMRRGGAVARKANARRQAS